VNIIKLITQLIAICGQAVDTPDKKCVLTITKHGDVFMKNKRNLLSLLFTFLMPIALLGQSVVGVVNDKEGNPLVGANVVVDGTDKGGVTDESGKYTIDVGASGDYGVTASYIGYSSLTNSVKVDDIVGTINFLLEIDAVSMSALEVLASRADKTTPVAYTTISKEEMEVRLGSQDIPMILNTTPSVYATQQGGGAGDARINVRGFNQRNVAVMINGVPQNDMENGWVYWSNWDGVGDATSSIQMQRGLSAVNLATPSIGGTMNIITDPAALERGGKFKQEGGAGGFLKSTLSYNSGLIGDKFALSGTVVRKTGDGLIDGTWTDALAYYVGGSYQLNKKNRFELYAIGAPQRHGQNLYKQNIATYSQELAGDIDGYNDSAYVAGEKFETEAGRLFNQNIAPVDASYTGQQYWYMYGARTTDRVNANSLNERENFFHKPLVNLNHFLTINDKTRVSSILYWSGGSGGGTGTYGSVSRTPAVEGERWYASSPWQWDWNAEIAQNSANVDSAFSDTDNRSTGILRNSINRQGTIGAISKLNYIVTDELELQVGIDWRTAEIEHAREVRDLLGGDYYVDFADDNTPDGKIVKLGDEIAYHNHTTVDWIGGFLQGNYQTDKVNVFGMGGISSIGYSYQDHFTIADEVITSDNIVTFQGKGGAMYDLGEATSIYGNFGYVEKPPIMDNVIYNDGTVASNPANEKFISTEFGLNFKKDDWLAIKWGAYHTDWKDRNLTKAVTTGQGDSGDTDVIFLTGVDQKHIGVEIEASIKLHDMVRFDVATSLGDWQFNGDAVGDYQENEYNENEEVVGLKTTKYQYALDGLKVGDMPQTSLVLGTTLTPFKGLSLQGLYKLYSNNFADWSPDSREYDGSDADADRSQVWEAPNYGKLDLHATYKLPKIAGLDMTLSAHIFNALDGIYVQDAVDNSQYNGYGDKVHAAHNAEVFLGTPRYANVGLAVNF
jgi:iron complex outermembrane receptor protein